MRHTPLLQPELDRHSVPSGKSVVVVVDVAVRVVLVAVDVVVVLTVVVLVVRVVVDVVSVDDVIEVVVEVVLVVCTRSPSHTLMCSAEQSRPIQ